MAGGTGARPGLGSAERLRAAQKAVLASLDPQVMKAFHRQNPLFDALSLALVAAAFLGLMLFLGSQEIGILWIAALLAQGLVLMNFGLLNHDLFVHRKLGGDAGWVMSLVLTLPIWIDNVGYTEAHRRHHRWIGTEDDGEGYKQDLDTRWKKLLFCTFIGVLRAPRGGFGREPRQYFAVHSKDPETLRRQRLERLGRIVFVTALVGLLVQWPRFVLLGYVVPLLFVLPVCNSLRILIEHADVDPTNPFSLATFYRTGPLAKVVCLWDSGDCHLIHHLFPNIPFYRISPALREIRPLLIKNGVKERDSYWQLFHAWFVRDLRHRTSWDL